MQVFNGTWRLLRLALRAEKWWIVGWVGGLALFFAFAVAAVDNLFATDAELQEGIALFVQNPAVRLFAMPTGGDAVGDFVSMRLYVTFAVLAALMSIFMATRQTRGVEETTQAELLTSTPVGRLSQLSAACGLVVVANVVLVLAGSLVMVGLGLPLEGALLQTSVVGAVGVVFGLIAALVA